MSLIQKRKGNDKTFSQLAESVLSHVLHEGSQSNRIDVVFDVYRDSSIKNTERINRGADTGIQFKNISPGHKFLVQEWKEISQRMKLKKQSVVCYM